MHPKRTYFPKITKMKAVKNRKKKSKTENTKMKAVENLHV